MSAGLMQGYGLGQLGQTHTAANTVSPAEVESEFASRGYGLPHVPPPVGHALTRSLAIKIAVDTAIVTFSLPRTSSHFYRCPTTGGCPVKSGVWSGMMTWTADVASGYLRGSYAVPSWALPMVHAGVSGLGVAPVSGWIQDNPWFITALAGILAAYGAYLTSQQVADAVKESAKPGTISKDDIPYIMQQLAAQGAIPPGKDATVEAGLLKATTPGWLWPVAIGGGLLVAVMLLKK